MSNPPRLSISGPVTTNIGKCPDRLIKITKEIAQIAQYFVKRAREDEYIANEMRKALKKEADN